MTLGMILQRAEDLVTKFLVKRPRLEAERVEIGVEASTLDCHLLDRSHQFRRMAFAAQRRIDPYVGNVEP